MGIGFRFREMPRNGRVGVCIDRKSAHHLVNVPTGRLPSTCRNRLLWPILVDSRFARLDNLALLFTPHWSFASAPFRQVQNSRRVPA